MKVIHFKFIGEEVKGGIRGVIGGWVGKVSKNKRIKKGGGWGWGP